MNNYGIIICLQDSINKFTIKHRTKNIINNLIIQTEIKHSVNSTIGCFNSHIKALKKSVELMTINKNIKYVIIGEEDIVIDYNSDKYINIVKSLKEYNTRSDYILHLGGVPSFTTNLNDIVKNFNNKYLIKTKVYLTTCYVVNCSIAKKLLKKLENSSRHIHCDAIFCNCGIKQYLVKGNLVNQLEIYKSKNTCLHNYISTKTLSNIFININKVSFLFISNKYVYIMLSIYLVYKNLYINVIFEMIIFIIHKHLLSKFINYKYNRYLPKNIFTYCEITKIFRLYTLFKLYS